MPSVIEMTDTDLQTMLAQLEKAYRHEPPEAFGALYIHAKNTCTADEWQHVQEHMRGIWTFTYEFKRLLRKRPLLERLLGFLWRKRTLYNEAMRQPLPTQADVVYQADEQGYYALSEKYGRKRRICIEDLRQSLIGIFGEERVSELLNNSFTVNVPLDERT